MREQQSILTMNRPDQVAWWLKRGRKANVTPVIDNPSAFAIAWQQWWKAMQPDWRRNDDKDKDTTTLARTAPDDDAGWSTSKLHRSGPVGFHLIIMALAWWGKVVKWDKDKKDGRKFLEAVEDVQWVLKELLKSFISKPKTKKRLADDDEPSSSNKK